MTGEGKDRERKASAKKHSRLLHAQVCGFKTKGLVDESKEIDGQRIFKTDLGSPACYIGIRL